MRVIYIPSNIQLYLFMPSNYKVIVTTGISLEGAFYVDRFRMTGCRCQGCRCRNLLLHACRLHALNLQY